MSESRVFFPAYTQPSFIHLSGQVPTKGQVVCSVVWCWHDVFVLIPISPHTLSTQENIIYSNMSLLLQTTSWSTISYRSSCSFLLCEQKNICSLSSCFHVSCQNNLLSVDHDSIYPLGCSSRQFFATLWSGSGRANQSLDCLSIN